MVKTFLPPHELGPEEKTPVDHDVIPTQLAMPHQEEITYTTRLRNEGIDKGRELCQQACPQREKTYNRALAVGCAIGSGAVVLGAVVFALIRAVIRHFTR